MDSTKPNNGCCKPEIGRGCTFCNGDSEPEAILSDGCFKLHETPWLEGYPDSVPTDIFEVRFKNTRRGFYRNVNDLPLKRGDVVAVEASPGHDIGIISLTGDLVARQMRRTGLNVFNGEFKKIYRVAKPYDIERWQEAIALEHETMIQARQIAADMGLNMKIGDVEYQGDKIKAIFYYIADERVDFRELIKVFAERFHIRIEMKQIGARQEAGRIGGLGACGRELCCASWIAGFSSVTTGAARVQDLSLNPQKLAGQCSKLKCCMMYEYDMYVDARKDFPRLREPLQTVDGEYYVVKSDVLAGTMTFSTSKDTMANVVTIPVSRVREILAQNRAGKKVDQLQQAGAVREETEEPTYRSEEDSITRFDKARRRKKPRSRGKETPDAETALASGTDEAQSQQPRSGRDAAAAPGERNRKPREGRQDGRGSRGRERRPEGVTGSALASESQERPSDRPRQATSSPVKESSAGSRTQGENRRPENRSGSRNRGRGRGNGRGGASEGTGNVASQEGRVPKNPGEGRRDGRGPASERSESGKSGGKSPKDA